MATRLLGFAAGADDLTLAESVGAVALVVLDRLSPAERAAFVLHDVFGLAFVDVAAPAASTPWPTRTRSPACTSLSPKRP